MACFLGGPNLVRCGAPLAAVAVLLSACGTLGKGTAPAAKVEPPRVTQAMEYEPSPGLTPRQRVGRAIELLGQGEPAKARPEVVAFLTAYPENKLGRSLQAQIDEDPKVLLGAQSFPYVLKSGETLSTVAERFLGDRFLFWALARYNGIETPSRTEVGQTVMIPGPPRSPAASRRRQTDAALIDARVFGPKPAPPTKVAKPKPVVKAPATAVPKRDPVRARQLRGSALEYLSRGLANRAVTLLEQALRLDPGNSLITRDLERARRLMTVR